MYIISACLLGENCKYSGGNNENERVCEFAKNHSVFAVCPEVEGGLPVPRDPIEIVNGRAVNQKGEDHTEAFEKGRRLCFEKACAEASKRGESIDGAILKANSPTCGCGTIYDGTFSHVKTAGDGMFTRYLKKNDILVITEEDEIKW
ncbi:MAG: DUF523 domain-containing protein [Clostridia bacterium]|nr:DUF523 domain-containing protein [Clostridia bacterium]